MMMVGSYTQEKVFRSDPHRAFIKHNPSYFKIIHDLREYIFEISNKFHNNNNIERTLKRTSRRKVFAIIFFR